MLKITLGALLSVFATINSADAAFIDYGTSSYDTRTGLEWLDTTQTSGLSYNAVKAGAGGWLPSGWRYATGNEVRDLFSQYVGTGPELFYTHNTQIAWDFVLQMGVNLSFNSSLGISQFYGGGAPIQISIDAFFDDGTNNSLVGLGELIARVPSPYTTQPGTGPGSRWVAYDDFWYLPNSVPTSGYGSFLVRNATNIPEPSTALLLIATCLGLALSRKRLKPVCIRS